MIAENTLFEDTSPETLPQGLKDLITKDTKSTADVPFQPTSLDIWDSKYRLHDRFSVPIDQTMGDTYRRVARTLADVEVPERREYWYKRFLWALENGAIPAGRITSNAGAGDHKTAVSLINCTVSKNIKDSMKDILESVTDAGMTLKAGCGIGYSFSTIRHRGAYVRGAGAGTNGPLAFMDIFDKMCFTVSSAGGRRGAQMGTFDVGHPDVEEFITAKREDGRLRQFNLSLLITDAFMQAVEDDADWPLAFPIKADMLHTFKEDQLLYRDWPVIEDDYVVNDQGEVACEIVRTVKAKDLWELIMRSTYDYAEPGFLLIDEVNRMNNNWFCEDIISTNPSLARGTMVHARHGIVPIEELEGKRFEVRALDGSWGPAECWKSSDSAKTKTLVFGPYSKVRSTLEHKWPVLDRLTGKIHRKLTSDLKVGDEIPKNSVSPIEINGDMTLTEEEGFFLGLWLADGWMTPVDNTHQIGFSFNKKDEDLAIRVLGFINSRKKAQSNLVVRDNSFELSTRSNELIEYCIERLGFHTGEKQLPSFIWKSNWNFLKGLIDGFISGDGHVSARRRNLTVVQKSESLIRDFHKLLSFAGITGDLRKTESSRVSFPNGKRYGRSYTRWDLRLSMISTVKLGSLVTLSCGRKQKELQELLNRPLTKGMERALYNRIEAIEEGSDGEPVWDVAVDHHQHLFPIEWGYTGNCGEQPLPPEGSCLLGSINLTKFVHEPFTPQARFDWDRYAEVVRVFTRMLDNVVEIHGLPLEGQTREILSKRRHGMGYLGLGSAMAMLGYTYGQDDSVEFTDEVSEVLAVEGWREALSLSLEKGPAPLLTEDVILTAKHLRQQPRLVDDGYTVGDSVPARVLHAKYSHYMQRIAEVEPELVEQLAEHGARFTHHSSIAPTGTISLSLGNNASNGIEPSFSHQYLRNVIEPGKKTKTQMEVVSFELLAYRHFIDPQANAEDLPVNCVISDNIEPEGHVRVQAAAQKWIDSSISKTVNVPSDFPYERFQNLYRFAYEHKLKGCTTFRYNPEVFQGVLVREEDLENTIYVFELEDGSTVELKGNERVLYDGQEHVAANLYDSLKENTYGKW